MSTLSIDRLFGPGSVLQHGNSVTIWGTGSPGASINLRIAESTSSGTIDDRGHWRLEITPPAIGGPYQFSAHSDDEDIYHDNILIGDVWICSGQSNMEWPFQNIPSAVELRDEPSPNIRFIRPEGDWSDTELSVFEQGEWRGTEGREAGPCSVVAYCFARFLQQHLNGRPIGLIVNAVGGSMIEAWIPQEKLLATPEWQRRAPKRTEPWSTMVDHNRMKLAWANRWFADYDNNTEPNHIFPKPPSHDNTWFCTGNQAGALYNTLTTPLAGLACSGVIWYQGESNVDLPDDYAALYELMVQSWRDLLNKPELPFYHVQLASWEPELDAQKGLAHIPQDISWPGLRAAQAECCKIPHTGMATAIDCGHRYDIHPPNKLPVGERLARLALNKQYSQDIVDSGPELLAVTVDENGVIVTFSQAENLCCANESGKIKGFMIRTEEGWLQAEGQFIGEGDNQCIFLPGTSIAEVAYASCDWQELNLYGSDGLPALPGRMPVK